MTLTVDRRSQRYSLFFEFVWGDPRVLFKKLNEVSRILKATSCCYLGHGIKSADKIFLGVGELYFVTILYGCHIIRLLPFPSEICNAHITAFGKRVKCYRKLKVLLNIYLRGLQSY